MVNLSEMDLDLLRILHVVLEERGVTRAAERLHVTPPAVSNALKRLREVLGDPLLVRSGRGLVPTPRALELQPTLARTFAALEHALRGRFDPATATRSFTLALTDADQLTGLPAIARRFARVMPRAHLRAVSVDVLLSSGGLEGTEVDLVLGPPSVGDGLHHEPLYREEGVFVVQRDHPRVRDRLGAARFRSERHVDVHIALGRGGEGHRAAEEALARQGLTRDIAVTVPTFTAAAWVAASTDLVAGIPRRLAEALASSLPIRIVRGPLARVGFAIGMTWHERTHADPGARCLRDVVRAALKA